MSKFKYGSLKGGLVVQLAHYRRTKRPIKDTPVPLLGTRERNYLNKAFEDENAHEYISTSCPNAVLSDQPTVSSLASKNFVKDCYDRYLLVPQQDAMMFLIRFDSMLTKVV